MSAQHPPDYADYPYEPITSTEHAPPPHPYVFSYTAGRYPGHADRTHSEVSDGSGIVRGSFSYIDPRQQIRTVDYTADQNGFHPHLSHELQPQQQSAAVKLATDRHLALYNKIAQSHANPPANQQVIDGHLYCFIFLKQMFIIYSSLTFPVTRPQ